MAATLAAFFSGLAVGGYHWGQKIATQQQPLKIYGWLELGVAVSALGYFLLLQAYALIYPTLFAWFGNERLLFLLVKFLLAMLILFPPAYCMGGTLPVLSHFVVRQQQQLGQKVSVLYVVNTLGAVVGVLLASFYLPPTLGYFHSYWVAIGLTVTVALVAFRFSSKQHNPLTENRTPFIDRHNLPVLVNYVDLKGLAFISGLGMLALQVLWGRMFAQVLQNSVYTFAIILVVFLLCLALGGAIARWLMSSRFDKQLILFLLLLVGGLLVAITPFEFIYLTHDLRYLGSQEGWLDYLILISANAFMIMAPSLCLLGTVFPLLLKLAEQQQQAVGRIVGQLVSINTSGAIVGSILAGFVILDTLGLWAGIRLIAVIYIMCAWYWLGRSRFHSSRWVIVPAVTVVLLVSVLDVSRLPLVRVDPLIDKESLLELWEGSAGTVAVIRKQDNLKVKVNNHYTLGGTASLEYERLQGYLPVLLHDVPKSVYVLGLGSGITAGASLKFPIKSLVVTELVPEVIEASDKYFHEYTTGLFYDPRAQVIAEDGRNYLRGTEQSFDVIISDLFVPWKAGVGGLYSLEHYQTIMQRLNNKGLFMQWLPTYQLSKKEFDIIAKTMFEVFPQVTVWRGDFAARKPIIGLLGHQQVSFLSTSAWVFQNLSEEPDRVSLMAHYVGNLGAIKNQYQSIAINTDNFPVIEFSAPVSQRQIKTGQSTWFAGEQLITFMQQLQDALPSTQDQYLQAIPIAHKSQAQAGLYLHRAQWLKHKGRIAAAEKQFRLFQQYQQQ
jgi:spermidine synthase